MEAFFLSTFRGHRFCIVRRPPPEAPRRGGLLYIHPFAEEMNCSRRMASLQAAAFARQGFTVLQIDLEGCGDSSGDFGDASWAAWLDDVALAWRWLAAQTEGGLWMWGLRSGCLLAAQAARGLSPSPVGLLFWQPVLLGRQHLNQFLRLAMVADLLRGTPGRGGDSLLERLTEGQSVEVAGYLLSPALALGLAQADLNTLPAGIRVVCLELSGANNAEISPALAAQRSKWGAGWLPGDGAGGGRTTVLASCRSGCQSRVVGGQPGPTGRGGRLSFSDVPVLIPCDGDVLLGIVSRPEQALTIGLVVVVGGPQYRVGSHRQFVLLAHRLADAGYPVLRFDYRGMGDSDGGDCDFDRVDEDIAQAISALQQTCPGVRRVVLWGLCDGASAALLYCHNRSDARIAGLCLLNPWVRTEASLARTTVKHYYIDRLLQKAFWLKLFSGRVALRQALGGMLRNLALMRRRPNAHSGGHPFQEKMALAWRRFPGSIQLILSGGDYTAKEFTELASTSPEWQGCLSRPALHRVDIAEADHTFSRAGWRLAVEQAVLSWMPTL